MSELIVGRYVDDDGTGKQVPVGVDEEGRLLLGNKFPAPSDDDIISISFTDAASGAVAVPEGDYSVTATADCHIRLGAADTVTATTAKTFIKGGAGGFPLHLSGYISAIRSTENGTLRLSPLTLR
jgi:hypothetical protein